MDRTACWGVIKGGQADVSPTPPQQQEVSAGSSASLQPLLGAKAGLKHVSTSTFQNIPHTSTLALWETVSEGNLRSRALQANL